MNAATQTITNYFTADQEAVLLTEYDGMSPLQLIQCNNIQRNLWSLCGGTDVMHKRTIEAKLLLIQDCMISRMG